jgi:hypothetical protein
MTKFSATMAKLAGLLKGVDAVLGKEVGKGMRPIQNFDAEQVGHYFQQYPRLIAALQEEEPDLYGDFALLNCEPALAMSAGPNRYSREQVERLQRDINQAFEIRANSAWGGHEKKAASRRVFISHGGSTSWREVQAFIEKDLKLDSLELAQEANLGRTIPEKLREGAARCDSAVIVMTAEDVTASGEVRARENVIHEVGFFQGSYGPGRVCLLYEEGTNIPTNMQGLVYSAFPAGQVSACFGLLMRELAAMYK